MGGSDLAAQNVARLQSLYADYAGGNRASLLDALADDVAWNSACGGVLPWAGLWRGRAGVEGYFARLDEELEVRSYAVEQVIAQGEWVAILARTRVCFRRSGMEQDFDKADFVRLRGGKVIEFREFYDTALLGSCACRPA
jgi:ketosteroid isomerase-like protein